MEFWSVRLGTHTKFIPQFDLVLFGLVIPHIFPAQVLHTTHFPYTYMHTYIPCHPPLPPLHTCPFPYTHAHIYAFAVVVHLTPFTLHLICLCVILHTFSLRHTRLFYLFRTLHTCRFVYTHARVTHFYLADTDRTVWLILHSYILVYLWFRYYLGFARFTFTFYCHCSLLLYHTHAFFTRTHTLPLHWHYFARYLTHTHVLFGSALRCWFILSPFTLFLHTFAWLYLVLPYYLRLFVPFGYCICCMPTLPFCVVCLYLVPHFVQFLLPSPSFTTYLYPSFVHTLTPSLLHHGSPLTLFFLPSNVIVLPCWTVTTTYRVRLFTFTLPQHLPTTVIYYCLWFLPFCCTLLHVALVWLVGGTFVSPCLVVLAFTFFYCSSLRLVLLPSFVVPLCPRFIVHGSHTPFYLPPHTFAFTFTTSPLALFTLRLRSFYLPCILPYLFLLYLPLYALYLALPTHRSWLFTFILFITLPFPLPLSSLRSCFTFTQHTQFCLPLHICICTLCLPCLALPHTPHGSPLPLIYLTFTFALHTHTLCIYFICSCIFDSCVTLYYLYPLCPLPPCVLYFALLCTFCTHGSFYICTLAVILRIYICILFALHARIFTFVGYLHTGLVLGLPAPPLHCTFIFIVPPHLQVCPLYPRIVVVPTPFYLPPHTLCPLLLYLALILPPPPL